MEFVRVGALRRDPRGRDAGLRHAPPGGSPSPTSRRICTRSATSARTRAARWRKGSSTTAPRRSSARATAACSTWRPASRSRVPPPTRCRSSVLARSTAGSRWRRVRARGRLAARLTRARGGTTMSDVRTRFDLQPDQIPTAWFNIMPDIVKSGIEPLPPLSPQTKQPIGPDDLAPTVPDVADRPGGLHRRVDRHPGRGDRRLPALEAVAVVPRDAARGRRWTRPLTSTSSTRASRRRAATSRTPPCRRRTSTRKPASGASRPRPGAGQWGSAMALACQMFGLECDVYMVKASYDQKPYRRVFMETFGAERRGLAERARRTAAARSARRIRTRPVPSASRSARRSRTPRPTTTRTTRSAACSATCCCTSR